jgi:arabinogalactan oligomer/maltooligosaccharide transport system permease protein
MADLTTPTAATPLPGVAGSRIDEASQRTGRRRGERGPLASIGLHLGLILAIVIALFPVAWVVITSFKPRADSYSLAIVRNFSFRNYSRVLDTEFPTWFLNSTVIALFTTLVGVFIAASAGYALSRFKFPAYRQFLLLFLVVQMFPAAVLIVSLYNVLDRLHLLNNPTGLVLAYCSSAVPFCVWMLKGYFDTIPPEIDEAGRVDGLTPFGTFWRLVIPLAKPGLAVTAFYSFITAWNELAFAQIFLTGQKKLTLPVGLATFTTQFDAQWDLLTAGAVLVTIPAVIVFFLAQRFLIAGLTAGGTKG